MTQAIKKALSYIDSNDRIIWIKIGAALKTELGECGLQLWIDWSQSSPKYNKEIALRQWKSFKIGRVKIGTLFHEAKKQGFKMEKADYKEVSSAELSERAKRFELEREEAKKKRLKAMKKAKENSRNIWEKAKPVDLNNTYLKNKNLTNCRFLKDIIKQDEKNNILVPMNRFGEMVGLQKITYTGDKFFEKNMNFENVNFLIGYLKNAKEKGLFLVEGFATGVSIHDSTGASVIVAFTGNNLKNLAKYIANNTDLKIYIAADIDDAGIEFALSAKEFFGDKAKIIKPIFNDDERKNFIDKYKKPPTDFNDLYILKGREEVAKQINHYINNVKKEPIKNSFKVTLGKMKAELKNGPSQKPGINKEQGIKI